MRQSNGDRRIGNDERARTILLPVLEDEVWLPLLESPGYYVSNLGRFYSAKVCRLIGGISRTYKGYACIRINKKTKIPHRIVATYFVSGYRPELQVNHINGNKIDNRAENLEWVTNQENRNHAVRARLHAYGVRAGLVKLTEDEVDNIRAAASAGMSNRRIAEIYSVHKSSISLITRRINWKYLK